MAKSHPSKRFPGDNGKRILIIGPIRHDPDTEYLSGMGWFVPYLDSRLAEDRLLWHVYPRLSRNRRPTRDHAIDAREKLLARPGAIRVDDWDVFLSIAKLVACARNRVCDSGEGK